MNLLPKKPKKPKTLKLHGLQQFFFNGTKDLKNAIFTQTDFQYLTAA